MKFWQYLIGTLMLLTIPYRVRDIGGGVKIVHVVIMPWARGMAIGNLVFTRSSPKFVDTYFVLHELEHVAQWREHGFMFPFMYLRASWGAFRGGNHFYYDNRFEVLARDAEGRDND